MRPAARSTFSHRGVSTSDGQRRPANRARAMMVRHVGLLTAMSFSASSTLTYWRRLAGLAFLLRTSANGLAGISFTRTACFNRSCAFFNRR